MLLCRRARSRCRPSLACFVGSAVACCRQPAVEFALDQAGIFEQPDDLGPYDLIEKILADRAVVANGPPRWRQASEPRHR